MELFVKVGTLSVGLSQDKLLAKLVKTNFSLNVSNSAFEVLQCSPFVSGGLIAGDYYCRGQAKECRGGSVIQCSGFSEVFDGIFGIAFTKSVTFVKFISHANPVETVFILGEQAVKVAEISFNV